MEETPLRKTEVAVLQQQVEAYLETISMLKKKLAILEAYRIGDSGGHPNYDFQETVLQRYVELCNEQINALKAKYKQKYADTVLKCQEHDLRCQDSAMKSRERVVYLEAHVSQLTQDLESTRQSERRLAEYLEETRGCLAPSVGKEMSQSQRHCDAFGDYYAINRSDADAAQLYHEQQLRFAHAIASDGLQDGVHIPIASPPSYLFANEEFIKALEQNSDDVARAQTPPGPTTQVAPTPTYRQVYAQIYKSPLPLQTSTRAVSPAKIARLSGETQALLQLYPKLQQNKLFSDALRIEIAAKRDVMFCVKDDGKIELLYLYGYIHAANLSIKESQAGFIVQLEPGQHKYVSCFAYFTSSAFEGVDLSGLGLKHVFLIVPKLRDFANLVANALEVAICEQCTRLAEIAVSSGQAKSVFAPKKTLIRYM